MTIYILKMDKLMILFYIGNQTAPYGQKQTLFIKIENYVISLAMERLSHCFL